MTPPAGDGPRITLPESDFEALLERAAEKGARRALADVGLDGEHAAEDVHDCARCSQPSVSRTPPPSRPPCA